MEPRSKSQFFYCLLFILMRYEHDYFRIIIYVLNDISNIELSRIAPVFLKAQCTFTIT
jgi:hypothetical protein